MLVVFFFIACITNVITTLEAYRSIVSQRSTQHYAALDAKINPLVDSLEPSRIIEINGLIKGLEKQGTKVFSLCIGEPDFQPPDAVIQATCKAAMAGATKYTAVSGTIELREAIVKDLKVRKSVTYTPEQIVVGNGAKQSVIQALMTVVNPGDIVLIPSPYWASYPDMVKVCQASPVSIATNAADGFALTPSALRSALKENPRTSAIILCNPSNPTGRNDNRKNIRELAEVLMEFPNVSVISDEIYERLVYDNEEHYSFVSVAPELFDRTITINGCSKSHAMTGYRIGYCATSSHLAKQISKLQSQLTSCPSAISQAAAMAAIEDPSIPASGWLNARLRELQQKRDLALALLQKIPQVTVTKPAGAFYLLPDVHHYYGKTYTFTDGSTMKINGSNDLCVALLQAERVAFVPGECFGDDACVRLSYATSLDIIEEALIRFRKFLLALH